jgi:hypothetical protein
MSISVVLGPVAVEAGPDKAACATVPLDMDGDGVAFTIASLNQSPAFGVSVVVAQSSDGAKYEAHSAADLPLGSGRLVCFMPGATTALIGVTNRDKSPAMVTIIAEEF